MTTPGDQPTVETREILRPSDRLAQLYRAIELIVPALLIGVAIGVHIPGIRQRLLALPPMWANAALIGDVALLAAAGLIAQALVQRHALLRTAAQLTLRLLATTLILLVACIVVVLWKYLVWLIPDTWTAQGASSSKPLIRAPSSTCTRFTSSTSRRWRRRSTPRATTRYSGLSWRSSDDRRRFCDG
ncbi:MAG: hypothetical protein M3068_06555 [Gemmatimonadota bacterium]|nr:hypothetical protein [Gemmatimonadota bacterium]